MTEKKRHFLKSLRSQLIVGYMAISIVFLSTGAYLIYRYTARLLTDNNSQYTLQEFRQADNNIQSVLNEVDRLSSLFLQSDDVQQLLQLNAGNSGYEAVQLENSVISHISQITQNYGFIDSIYLYTSGNLILGSSSRHTYLTANAASVSSFLRSDVCQAAYRSFPKQVLGDCVRASSFNPNLPEGDDSHVVVAARKIRSFFQSNRSAVLVFNIKETSLSSFYNGSAGLNNNSIFIMSRQGRVVSSQTENLLETQSPWKGQMDLNRSYGGTTLKTGKTPVQIVYYGIKNTNWFLVAEIPLRELEENLAHVKYALWGSFLFSVLLIFLISDFSVKKILHPLETLSGRMSDMGRGKLGITLKKIPCNEIGGLIRAFNSMSVNIAKLVRENERMQTEKTSLEIDALQAQINPHFIYNTLNMIKWMAAMNHSTNIEESVIALGNLLGPAFREKRRMWMVREEIDYLENYLKIMNWRFGNTLDFQFSIPDSLTILEIPKFVLQPIVENSVVHGLQDQVKVQIEVKAFLQGGNLRIEISDNGSGIEPEKRKALNLLFCSVQKGQDGTRRETVGLLNVNRRIRLNFGEPYGLEIQNLKPHGTNTVVLLPQISPRAETEA